MIKTNIICSNCKNSITIYKHSLLNYVVCENCGTLLQLRFINSIPKGKVSLLHIKLLDEVEINKTKYSLVGHFGSADFEIFILVRFQEIILVLKKGKETIAGKLNKLYHRVEFNETNNTALVGIDKYFVKETYSHNITKGIGQIFFNPINEKIKIIKILKDVKYSYLIITETNQFLLDTIHLSIKELQYFTKSPEDNEKEIIVEVPYTKAEKEVVIPTKKAVKEEQAVPNVQVREQLKEEKIIKGEKASHSLFSKERRIVCAKCYTVFVIKEKANKAICPSCENIQILEKKEVQCPACKFIQRLKLGDEVKYYTCKHCNNLIHVKTGEVIKIKVPSYFNRDKLIRKLKRIVSIGDKIHFPTIGINFSVVGFALVSIKIRVDLVSILLIYLHNPEYGWYIMDYPFDGFFSKNVELGAPVNIDKDLFNIVANRKIIKYANKYFLRLGEYRYRVIYKKGEILQEFNKNTFYWYAHPYWQLIVDDNNLSFFFRRNVLFASTNPNFNKLEKIKKAFGPTFIALFLICIISVFLGYVSIFIVAFIGLAGMFVFFPGESTSNRNNIRTHLRNLDIDSSKLKKYGWQEWKSLLHSSGSSYGGWVGGGDSGSWDGGGDFGGGCDAGGDGDCD